MQTERKQRPIRQQNTKPYFSCRFFPCLEQGIACIRPLCFLFFAFSHPARMPGKSGYTIVPRGNFKKSRNFGQYPHCLVGGTRPGFQSVCCVGLGHLESQVGHFLRRDLPHNLHMGPAFHYSTGCLHRMVPWGGWQTYGFLRMFLNDWRLNTQKMHWTARDGCQTHGYWPLPEQHQGRQ